MPETYTGTRGYPGEKQALVKRLHRIAGQVHGLERMVTEDRCCPDIITQISAVSRALESLAFEILDDHVKHCVAGALTAQDMQTADLRSRDLLDAVHRFARMR